jgi:hypothetical protein
MRMFAPGADHGGGLAGPVAPQRDHGQPDHLADLPGDRRQHLRRCRAARHERRDPPQRRPLRGEDLIVLAQLAFGSLAILDVGERHDRTAAFRHIDRHGGVGDGEHRSIAPEEPLQITRDRLACGPREQHRAILGGIRRAVRAAVVNRVVAAAPEQLVRVFIAQRCDGGRVREPDDAVRIDHPDRLCGRTQDSGEEILGTNPQASEIDQGVRHAKLR